MRTLIAMLRARYAGRGAQRSVSSVIAGFENAITELQAGASRMQEEKFANNVAISTLESRNGVLDTQIRRAWDVSHRLEQLVS